MNLPALPLRPLAFLMLGLPCAAEIPVFDGDDLQAVVDGAPDGEVLTLLSNGTFSGTLSWSGRSLTLRAAPGFSPTIEGDFNAPALQLDSSLAGTQALLQGLRLRSGPPSPTTAMLLVGAGNSEQLTCTLENCVVQGALVLFGTGTGPFASLQVELSLQDTELQGEIEAVGSGTADVRMEVCASLLEQGLLLASSGTARTTALIEDSMLARGFETLAQSSAGCELVVRRTRLLDGALVGLNSETASMNAILESCSFRGGGSGTGLRASPGTKVRGVNLTLTGFTTALDATPSSSFENLCLFGNVFDLDPNMVPGVISNSLIEDGSFAGVAGNFAGTPFATSDLKLVKGSIGIDAGNSSATGMGPLDINGEARIQDGDDNGIARVNVGAHEGTAACTSASHVLVNGSALNPLIYSITAEPVLGSDLIATVATNGLTTLTVVIVTLSPAGPSFLPGVFGEILVDLNSVLNSSLALGDHAIPVPDQLGLCAKTVASQAFRVEVTGAGPQTIAGNGALLTFGGL